MHPFSTTPSPLEIALGTALDTVWVIGFVIGWAIALIEHFTAPTGIAEDLI
jgi:hypothetical protein